jgi:hypothetical protein
MSELRVPMNAMPAEAVCADGRTFVGRIFVPSTSHRHSGPMRAEEWMNDPAAFFALLPDDGGGPMLLNKHEVLALTVPRDADHFEEEAGDQELPRRRVVVECGDRRLTGSLVIDMPATNSRVLDYLNRQEPFLTLHDGDRHHLVRKARVTRVVELRED